MPGFGIMFLCYLYYIPSNGNINLRKFRQDLKPTVRPHAHVNE